MTAQSERNPGFGDRLIKLLPQADMRHHDLAARIDAPLEVVQACLKGEGPEAEVLYRIAKALDSTMKWRAIAYIICRSSVQTVAWRLWPSACYMQFL